MKATAKVSNVNASAKRAGKAHPTVDQMVGFCVACFSDYLTADATLQNAKALWDAARQSLRVELARAYKFVKSGKPWDTFIASVRDGIVRAGVCETSEDAGRLIRNQLTALNISGNGAKKGGKKRGRKEVTSTGEATNVSDKSAVWNANALAYIARAQEKYAGDGDMLEVLGEIAACLTGDAE